MYKISKRTVLLIAAMVLVVVFMSGCLTVITDMNHPTTVADNATFDVTHSTSTNDSADTDPVYVMVCVMMPDNFDWVTGTWDMVGGGNGLMVATDEATTGIDLEAFYTAHPVPAGYSWRQFRTSDTYDPTGSTADYVVDYTWRWRGHLLKDEAYTMSYAGGWVAADMSSYVMGEEADQSWDNPITVTSTGIESTSLGNIKAEFK